jgi:cytidyltransferase-like protein
MDDSMEHFNVASVHGRFQPLHNGHLEYIQAAFKRCDFLYIGITQHVLHRLTQVSSASAVHRAQPESNPLTYFERMTVIDAVLTSVDIPRDRFAIMPFPIEEPSELHEFLPLSVPVLTTTYDDWNRAKIETRATVLGKRKFQRLQHGSSKITVSLTACRASLRLRNLSSGESHGNPSTRYFANCAVGRG